MKEIGRTVIMFIVCAAFSCGVPTTVTITNSVEEELPVALEVLRNLLDHRVVKDEQVGLRRLGAKWPEVIVEVRPMSAKRAIVRASTEGPVFMAQDAVFRVANMLLSEEMISPDEMAQFSAVKRLRAMELSNGLGGQSAIWFDDLRARRTTAAPSPYRTRIEYAVSRR